MKRFSSHLLVAIFTFAVSVGGMTLFFYQSSKNENAQTNELTVQNKLESAQIVKETETPKQTELESLSPYEIRNFINNNPQTNVENVREKFNIAGKFNSLPNWEKMKVFLDFATAVKPKPLNIISILTGR